MEFIESGAIDGVEDSGDALLKAVSAHEAEVRELISEKGYTELVAGLEKIRKAEEDKGHFVAKEGDIDIRPAEKLDMELSTGFLRECGVKGGRLSGGQKQRVAIARAIVRRPSVLILDEATSALDEASQRKVQAALDNIMGHRTSIVIAHRLSTVEKCDRILVLESGRLVEEGGFAALRSKQDGVFANLASGMQQAKH